MTDYAALTRALYRHYGTWRKVAEMCGIGSPALYWKIANRKILSPGKNVKSVILKAVNDTGVLLPAVTSRISRIARKNVSYSVDLYKKMEALKNMKNQTWEQFGEMALKAVMDNE